jgi:hypothetical protein
MTLYLIETMPDHLRESHRAARNWGTYPHNGAERSIVDESSLPDEGDEYDHVVRVATPADIARYGDAPEQGPTDPPLARHAVLTDELSGHATVFEVFDTESEAQYQAELLDGSIVRTVVGTVEPGERVRVSATECGGAR